MSTQVLYPHLNEAEHRAVESPRVDKVKPSLVKAKEILSKANMC